MEENKVVALLPEPPKEVNISYNQFLFEKRKELKLSRRKFAKLLKISKFRYKLLENGYIKPAKRDIRKISAYFDIDFNLYLEGFNSYPSTINNIRYNPLSNFMYLAFKKKGFRIALLVITILCLLSTITGFIIYSKFDSSKLSAQEDIVIELQTTVIEKGKSNFSIANSNYPIYTDIVKLDDGNEKAISIKSRYDEKELSLDFSEIYWYNDYRITYSYTSYIFDDISWTISVTNYDTLESASYFATEKDGKLELMLLEEITDPIVDVITNNDINKDFDYLIQEKMGLNSTVRDIVASIKSTSEKYKDVVNPARNIAIVALFLSFVFVFLFGYASIYGKEKDEIHSFNHSDELLGIKPLNKKIKKDIRIYPFIPETVLRLIGFLLIFLGAFRIMLLTYNVIDYSVENLTSARELLSIQMLGIFIVFFINFDIFMKDSRIFRNLLMYPLLFLFLYIIEAYLLSSITRDQSVISLALDNFSFPNPFFSATCYFLIIVFLFLTPNYIKTRKKLIIYRSMAIIPIIIILLAFILSNADILFGVKFSSYWTKLLFIGDKFPLSILAITYLVSLFFLRLHYKRKYGEENAEKYFNGNRYIFTKNALAVVLIVIIWAFEMLFSKNATLNSMGIGTNTSLIILAPLFLLYHPHKNARNAKSDILLITIYGLVLAFLYVLGVLVALAGLLM